MQKINKFFLLVLNILIWFGCKPVINKMAFHPDTENVIPTNQLPKIVKEIFIETNDKIKIQGYFLRDTTAKDIIIYFHGNAGNIGHRLDDLIEIHSFRINVLGIGYRGYGKSEGQPSEDGIYLDGRSALDYSLNKLGFPITNTFILGRSIGTTVAINISQNKNLMGIILVTPLTSGKEHAVATGLGSIALLAGDAFNNIGKVGNITCPTLVIHGTHDQVIPFTMGEEIFKKINSPKKFIKLEGAGHNNLSNEFKESYWPPIQEFILQ